MEFDRLRKGRRWEFCDLNNVGYGWLEHCILTRNTKAGWEPVRAHDCWISTDTQHAFITKHRGLRITNDAFLDETKRGGFSETVFVASKVQASLVSLIRRPILLHSTFNDSWTGGWHMQGTWLRELRIGTRYCKGHIIIPRWFA